MEIVQNFKIHNKKRESSFISQVVGCYLLKTYFFAVLCWKQIKIGSK